MPFWNLVEFANLIGISFLEFTGSKISEPLTKIQLRTYSDCFVDAMVMEADRNKDIVMVHGGMEMEKPLQLFQEKYPDRFFDVGMAEQHAVTFSAGLSCGGLKPFCIIPSAFLQRAFDQVYFTCASPSSSESVVNR